MSLTRSEIAKIEQIIGATGLTEVRVERNGECEVIVDPNAIAPRRGSELIAIAAPAVGSIFHERTHAGQRVKAGEVLGRLRVLDADIPITAPASGRVVAIFAEDGGLVTFGEDLILLDPEYGQ